MSGDTTLALSVFSFFADINSDDGKGAYLSATELVTKERAFEEELVTK